MKCFICKQEFEDDGLVDTVTAWYGSRHDCIIFKVCICDDCLDTLPVVGRADIFTGEPL